MGLRSGGRHGAFRGGGRAKRGQAIGKSHKGGEAEREEDCATAQNDALDPVGVDDVIRNFDALNENLGHEAEHQQREAGVAAERVDSRLAVEILGRRTAEEMADAVPLLAGMRGPGITTERFELRFPWRYRLRVSRADSQRDKRSCPLRRSAHAGQGRLG